MDVEEGMNRGMPVFQGSAEVKAGFIRKVYGLLSNQGMLFGASIAPFGFLGALYCYKDRHPLDLGLLSGFTLSIAYTVGVVCALYREAGIGFIVIEAFVLTAAVFVSLTAYVHLTKKG